MIRDAHPFDRLVMDRHVGESWSVSQLDNGFYYSPVRLKVVSMFSVLKRIRWSCHYYGVPMTCLSVVARVAGRLGWEFGSTPAFLEFKDRAIDRRFKISTVGTVRPDELDVDSIRKQHAIQYQPTCSLDLAILLEALSRRVEFGEFSFVDFGSGKGRVLLMASEFPFRSVKGVEFSAALHKTACDNISSYQSHRQKCRDVESICQDATEFQLPDGPVIAFFFNPFDDVIMRRVLDNFQQSIAGNSREIFCIYHNPVHRALLDQSSAWHELSGWPIEQEQWAVYQCKAATGGV